MKRPLIPVLLLSFAMIPFGLARAQGAAGGNEAWPKVQGADVAAPALLKGPYHTVVEPVIIEGHMARFVIESRFGNFSVLGERMLAVRVSELAAIETLQNVQQSDAFKEALSASGGKLVDFGKSAVSEPGKTVENIGSGIGTVLGRVAYLAKSGTEYVGDKVSDATSSAPREAAQAKPETAGEPEPPAFIGDPLGYNMARREWAKKLNIDPYTTNPVLRPLLDKAATATFAGNFGVNATVGALVGPWQLTYEFDDLTRQSVWNNPAIDLEKSNKEKLAALGIPERAARNLTRNKWFTPTLQTALVARMESLGKIKGIESVVTAATAAQGESRARFLLESVGMLAEAHRKETPFVEIRMSNLVPAGITSGGRLVAAVGIDYGIWDKDAAAFVQRKEFAGSGKTLLVAGMLSAQAQQMITKAGWEVKPRLRSARKP